MTNAGSLADTTAMLQLELPQLEAHQQSLQKELAQVTERLESVRGALTALNALAGTTLPQPRTEAAAPTVEAASVEPVANAAPEPAPAAEAPQAAEVTVPAQKKSAPARPSTTRKAPAAPRKKPASKAAETRRPKKKAAGTKAVKTTTAKAPAPAATSAQDSSGLTDQVIAVLAGRAATPLRARDVAEALGRDNSAGAINTVRSTLDRLVATSRAHRAGRGLYQAPAN
ncbi:hypothetical protein ABZ070_03125 [Streptomyces sp. NPDC006283]|uniref:hypothetical protein n=1 Tax=Streptomyces sp. NPDC006283 TaxID=3156741 RepID=UPI0033A39915